MRYTWEDIKVQKEYKYCKVKSKVSSSEISQTVSGKMTLWRFSMLSVFRFFLMKLTLFWGLFEDLYQ